MNEFDPSFMRDWNAPILFIDTDKVNLEDLLNMRPGSIVRCDVPPSECIRVVDCIGAYDYVAAMISEDA